ncbi:MAG TPA: polysaccharide pyruvyl transferase family protein [Polyangiaceae bacterium]|nr:polysaccharide pyruvyl transferase family protein [Polyangiaceae bacterium]
MERSKSRVLIAGVAGYNRGDDAILHALVGQLRSRFELDGITATVLKRGVAPDSVREVLIDRKSPVSQVQLVRAVARSSLLMLGGGSILHEEVKTTWLRGIMAFFVEVVTLARLFSVPVVTAPIGIDELRTDQGKKMARFILGQCRLIAVRDERSAAIARELLGPGTEVILGSDPAFCLNPRGDSTERTPPYLVLSPAFEATSSAELPDLLASIVERFLSLYAYGRCILIAIDERAEEDGGRVREIIERLPVDMRPRVELRVPATVNDVLSLLQGSIGLVTMRLHPMILGAGLTPVLCLSRGVKTDAIAAELSVPVISVRSEAWSAVRARAKAFITEIASTENRERFVRASAAAAALQRARVEDYFSALRPFLPAKTGAWKAA